MTSTGGPGGMEASPVDPNRPQEAAAALSVPGERDLVEPIRICACEW